MEKDKVYQDNELQIEIYRIKFVSENSTKNSNR